MTSSLRGLVSVALAIAFLGSPERSGAQQLLARNIPETDLALPAAPEPQPPANSQAHPEQALASEPGALPETKKYDPVIEPGQKAPRLSPTDKFMYSNRQNIRILNLFPALYSAGYEQLTGSDPKYGSDAGAGAAKFGASMLLSTTTRTLSDGIFAGVFHQDPRYYRVANGSIMHRGLRSASRALVRRSDDGVNQINASGLLGRAAAAALTLAYYPDVSANASVVAKTFGISIATDAGGDLVLEFFPDLVQRFKILKRFRYE